MVATLCKLKLAIIRNGLKRSTAVLIFSILGIIMVLPMIPGIGIGAVAVAFGVHGHDADVAAVVTLIGTVVVLVWAFAPLLFFGSDETLDPRRFALFPIPRRPLTIGLYATSFIGLGGVFTVLGSLAVSLVWVREPIALAAGIVGMLLGCLICVALSRCLTTLASQGLSSRRGRDFTAGISVLVIVLLSMSFSIVMQATTDAAIANGNGFLAALRRFGGWLAWTPLGAPWALGGDVATGSWGLAAVHLAIALVSLGALLWVWSRALSRAMVTPLAATGGGKVRADDAVLRASSRPWWPVGAGSTAAVWARCLRYWRTDPRYISSAIAVPLIPIMFTVLALTMPDYPAGLAVMAAPFAALMMGFSISNDIASDSTAFWLHVQTGVSGVADRLGRALALIVWGLPLLLVVSLGSLAAVGAFERWPAAVGMSVGLVASSVAVASVASALVAYPVALPGESPFSTKTGRGGMQMVAAFGVLGGTILAGLPVIVVGAIGAFGDPVFGWITLAVGVILGAVELAVGIKLGASAFERRKVALLAAVVSYDSKP